MTEQEDDNLADDLLEIVGSNDIELTTKLVVYIKARDQRLWFAAYRLGREVKDKA